jgi:hypothetical protein
VFVEKALDSIEVTESGIIRVFSAIRFPLKACLSMVTNDLPKTKDSIGQS